MATTKKKTAKAFSLELPAEIWARVFGHLVGDRDILDLWTSCRPLCRTFKEKVELLFSDRHLPKTYILFDLGTYRPDEEEPVCLLSTQFEFSHLSEDKATAFFQCNIPSDFKHKQMFIQRFRQYVENINREENVLNTKHIVQVRRSVNDAAIPHISVNFETLEFTCDWRGMFSALFYEESRVNDLLEGWVTAKNGPRERMKARIQRGEISAEESLIWAMESFGKQQNLDIEEARRERIMRQIKKWYESTDRKPDLTVYKPSEDSLERLKTLRQLASEEEFSDEASEEDDEDEEDEKDEDEDDEWEDEEDSKDAEDKGDD